MRKPFIRHSQTLEAKAREGRQVNEGKSRVKGSEEIPNMMRNRQVLERIVVSEERDTYRFHFFLEILHGDKLAPVFVYLLVRLHQ